MHAQILPLRRSVWADLDALVLEEVDALRARPVRPPAKPPVFGSDDEFLAQASAYLRGRGDAERLLERLSDELVQANSDDQAEAGMQDDTAGAAPPGPGPLLSPEAETGSEA